MSKIATDSVQQAYDRHYEATLQDDLYRVKAEQFAAYQDYKQPASIQLGSATLDEDTVHKLLALLEVIEGADDSELNTLLSTVIALRKIKA